MPETGGRVSARTIEAEPARPAALPNTSMHADADAALFQALLEKQPHAARVVWQRFSPMVRRIVRRTLGPESDAEDLVQDVFMQLFARVHTLRDPKLLKAFIIAVTTLTLRRELRRRKVRSWLGLRSDPLAMDLRVVHPDPIGRAALGQFYKVLDRLDPRERTAFALRCIEGLAMDEVAAALGVSLATAKRSLAHAQRRVLLHVERDPLLSDYLALALREASRD